MAWALASALWLGILTSISPCPLATNIAAISFLGRRVAEPGAALRSGLAYTAGRAATFMVLGAVVVTGLTAIPATANFLTRYLNQLLGPALILVGMVLLDLIALPLPGGIDGERMKGLAERGGVVAPALLGAVFALSLCPVSAGLFFGGLIPLAVKHGSRALLPAVYGAGTGLPVLGFALLLALGANRAALAFNRVSRAEVWLRRLTGMIFIAVGIYYALLYIFEV